MSSPKRKWFLTTSFAFVLFLSCALVFHQAVVGQADPKGGTLKLQSQGESPKRILDALPAGGKTPVTTAILDRPAGFDKPIAKTTVGDLLQLLSEMHKVTFRVDTGYYLRQGLAGRPYDLGVEFPIVQNLTVRDMLEEVCSVLSNAGESGGGGLRFGIQVRGSQIVIAKRFIPPTMPRTTLSANPGDDITPFVTHEEIAKMLYGPSVNISVDRKPLGEVLDQLRDASGANLVADPRIKEKLAMPVTLTANDSPLLTVLKLAVDPCEVGVAVVDNVFYVTTKENAARYMLQTERNLFGSAVPPG